MARKSPEIPDEVIKSDFEYSYPKGLDLHPRSDLHRKIVDYVWRMGNDATEVIQGKMDTWRRIDETMTAYIALDSAEKKVKEKDSRRPVSVVVPLSYATREILLTYLMTALLEPPIFKYEAANGEDVQGAALLELLIAQQCSRKKAALSLRTHFSDGLTYGLSPIHPRWTVERGTRGTVRRDPIWSLANPGQIIGYEEKIVPRKQVVYEGVEFDSIDPYMYLPDPNTPIDQPQRGEFVGWVVLDNLMNLLSREKENKREWFNVKYLRAMGGNANLMTTMGMRGGDIRESRENSPFNRAGRGSNMTRPVDIVNMYVKLIPSDWGLGDSDSPEKWMFTVAGDRIVIRCKPLGLWHDQFPVAVCAPDADGHSLTPVSRMEMVDGMQGIVNFMLNSMVANQRKFLHDMWVADPSVVNINDILNPGPGKIMRIRRAFWGRPDAVRNAVHQFPVNDITGANIGNISFMNDIVERAVGAPDALHGVRRKTSERVSATEAGGTERAALSRLEALATTISLQSMHDIAFQLALNTQQLMSEETQVKVIGKSAEVLADIYGTFAPVNPKAIMVDFDVMPLDATMFRRETLQGWMQILDFATRSPDAMAMTGINMRAVFKQIARFQGIKDIRPFLGQPMQMQVVPDERAALMAQQGNAVPLGIEAAA